MKLAPGKKTTLLTVWQLTLLQLFRRWQSAQKFMEEIAKPQISVWIRQPERSSQNKTIRTEQP
jgi:hypothetical protein